MGFFKKLGKGLKKLSKSKLVKAAVRAGAGALTSGASEAVIRVTKGIGAFNPKKPIQKVPSTAVKAIVERTNRGAAKKLKGLSDVKAETMPGGAPLKLVKPRSKKAPRIARKAAKSSGKGRRPPTGGKDFKALSQAWNAAGKPGKWIDFVKANG